MRSPIQVASRLTVEQLRELVGAQADTVARRSSFSLYPEGLPQGGVIELVGEGKTQWVAQFLAEHRDFKVAWVERVLSVYPYGLMQKGVKLEQVLFIEAGREITWTLAQVLASGCFRAVVSYSELFSENELRRLQLLSERTAAHIFVLSEASHKSWVPVLQIEVQKSSGELVAHVLRRRGAG